MDLEFADAFLPSAGTLGTLPVLTYFFISATAYAFLGNVIFSLATRQQVAPEHRLSQVHSAVIAAVAGVSYFIISQLYHDYLEELAHVETAEARALLTRQAYSLIGQYRYFDWVLTTPLLLLKTVSALGIKFRQEPRRIALLLLADVFMVVTGYVGEQQLGPDHLPLAGPKLLWGAISTLGYVLVPLILWQLWRRHAAGAHALERRTYRLLALASVTTWGVYPLGYLLSLTGLDPNYLHLSFSVFDVINKVGVAVVAYLFTSELLEERAPEKAVLTGHTVG